VQVAIKTVLFQASGDIHSDPVLREAMLALRIAHPNLVATYRANVRMLEDAGLQNAGSPGNIQFRGDITPSYQLFLLQEYCDSGTLYDWLSRERMHPGNIPDKVRNSKVCKKRVRGNVCACVVPMHGLCRVSRDATYEGHFLIHTHNQGVLTLERQRCQRAYGSISLGTASYYYCYIM
jgi:serine/threonine protein kinase